MQAFVNVLHLMFLIESLTEPGAHLFYQGGWAANPRDPPVCFVSSGIVAYYTNIYLFVCLFIFFFVGTGDLNSSCLCGRQLPVESSLAPSSILVFVVTMAYKLTSSE